MTNTLIKDGLTGNTGLGVGGFFHVSANYAATKDKVFVETRDHHWRRMTRAAAEKQDRRIIPCTYCKRPAISLDHSWPYLKEATHCAHHRDWMKHANMVEGVV